MSDTLAVTEKLLAFGLGEEDLLAWRRSRLPDVGFDAWLIDRVARRPEGERARRVYGAEDVHEFARRTILDALALTDSDHLLDVGCGGGLLLRDALPLGARATGVDHSLEMVTLALVRAPGAEVHRAPAERLPFRAGTFTAVSMSMVFFFLEEPVRALAEAGRVLADAGRVAVLTTGPELRGTPAAPEPIATFGRFYSPEELADLAERAGLRDVTVLAEDGGQLLSASR